MSAVAHPLAHPTPRLPSGVWAWLRRAARRIAGQWRRRREEDHRAAALAMLDEATLRDLGLARCDIGHVARFGLPGHMGCDATQPRPVRNAGWLVAAVLAGLLPMAALAGCAADPSFGVMAACEGRGLRAFGSRGPVAVPACDAQGAGHLAARASLTHGG
jgi:uncharacterized protein YjiS (DUF1127 family)